MHRLGIDLTGPLPPTNSGKVWILVVQDYFSKWVELFPLATKECEEVARVLYDEVFTRYGACERLHSDQGGEFDNRLMAQLCKLWEIDKTRTSGFAPWSNGLVERTDRSLKGMLRHLGD